MMIGCRESDDGGGSVREVKEREVVMESKPRLRWNLGFPSNTHLEKLCAIVDTADLGIRRTKVKCYLQLQLTV